MDITFSIIKTLIVPAFFSLLIFLLFTFILIPSWRRHRSRYAQYIPLDALSLRHRILNLSPFRWGASTGAASSPTAWPWSRYAAWRWRRTGDADADDDDDDDDSDRDVGGRDGEELGALGARGSGPRDLRPEFTRRLSRDLEEGFRDDSDDESDP